MQRADANDGPFPVEADRLVQQPAARRGDVVLEQGHARLERPAKRAGPVQRIEHAAYDDALVVGGEGLALSTIDGAEVEGLDRKSTRLNSSHLAISYAG